MNRKDIVKYSKNLSTYFGASLIPMLLNLLINPWIALNMSPKDYAITGYYTSFSSLIGPIITFYMIHFYIKEYFKLDDEGRKILFAAIGKALIWFSGFISILCLTGLLLYLRYIDTDNSLPVSPYLFLVVLALPLTGLLNLQLAKFRMEKDANAYLILFVFNGLLNVLLIMILVIFLKWGAFGKLLATFLCNLIIFIILSFRLRRYLLKEIEFAYYLRIFKFCLPLALSAMLGYFTTGFSTTYLESIGDNIEYGIYVVGVSIGSYIGIFATAISNTFQPDLYETTIKKQWKRYFKFCLLQIGSISVVTFLFIICAPIIIDLLTASRYVASTVYAQIVALCSITSSIYYIINNYTIATGRPKLYLYTTILGSIGIVVSMPVAVDKYSYIGGCVVSVLSFILFAIINIFLLMIWGKKHVRI